MKFSQKLALSYLRTKFKLIGAISKKKAAEQAFELFCTPQRRNKKPLPAIFEKAETLHFKLDGIQLTGWRWNKGGIKKLLLLHGFESSVINFDRYIRPFVKKGYEVLAFDAPAHGRSEGQVINAPLYRKMILEIYRKYGPIDHFIAHSFGGLALSLALEEINDTVDKRMVLIAPATETVTAIDTFFRFLNLDPAIREDFDKTIIRKGGLPPSWYSIKRAMKHIKATVLWVHDENDDTTPLSDVKELMKDRPSNIEFYITKGLGHRRIYRDAEVTHKIIEFL
jgi:pimeloyl-ACP methyl ester carboxylesterase